MPRPRHCTPCGPAPAPFPPSWRPQGRGIQPLRTDLQPLRTTALARSIPPSPPRPKTSLSTAARAPAASDRSLTIATSPGVSVGKRLIATTTGSPNDRMTPTRCSTFAMPLETAASLGLSSSRRRTRPVRLDGPYRRDEHDRAGLQSIESGLNVHELLEPEVRSEARLGYDVVAVGQRKTVAYHRAAPVGDVPERPRVHDNRLPLQGSARDSAGSRT